MIPNLFAAINVAGLEDGIEGAITNVETLLNTGLGLVIAFTVYKLIKRGAGRV
jgi:hypothetical protein